MVMNGVLLEWSSTSDVQVMITRRVVQCDICIASISMLTTFYIFSFGIDEELPSAYAISIITLDVRSRPASEVGLKKNILPRHRDAMKKNRTATGGWLRVHRFWSSMIHCSTQRYDSSLHYSVVYCVKVCYALADEEPLLQEMRNSHTITRVSRSESCIQLELLEYLRVFWVRLKS